MKIVEATLLAAVCAMLCCGCQNVVSLKSGNLALLKGSKTVNVEYSYEGMKVGNRPEQEYVKKMMESRDKESPGAGENWLETWRNNRAARYQPKFEQLLNKQTVGHNIDLYFGDYPTAKYTLLLKTTRIRLGYNATIMARPALLDAEAIFFETQNPKNQIAVVTFKKMVGTGALEVPYDQGTRVQEAYAKAGKELGKRIAKKVK